MTPEEIKACDAAGYEKLGIARLILLRRTPYYSKTAYSLVPITIHGLGTAYTTQKLVLGFDPVWLAALSDEEAAGLLWHEIQHIVGHHFERGRDFPDPARANKAGDLAINCSAVHIGFTLPPNGLYPEKLGFPTDLSMEEYYELLGAPPAPPKKEKPKGGRSKKKGPAPTNPSAPAQKEASSEGTEGEKPGLCHGHCGGVAGNGDAALEEQINAAAEQASPGCVKTELEVQVVLRQAAKELLEHVSHHGRGTIPAHLVQKASLALAPPKVPWRAKLRKVLRHCAGRLRAGGSDYSKARPSKRSHLRGIVLPGLVTREPDVAFVRDTSGSMGMAQLRDAQNEAIGVMKALGLSSVWFLDADAGVGQTRRVRMRDIPKIPRVGGGGTDFAPALAAIRKLRPRPQLVLYFTDGDGGAPAVAPVGITVIWVIVRSYWNKAPATWGHAIFVDDD